MLTKWTVKQGKCFSEAAIRQALSGGHGLLFKSMLSLLKSLFSRDCLSRVLIFVLNIQFKKKKKKPPHSHLQLGMAMWLIFLQSKASKINGYNIQIFLIKWPLIFFPYCMTSMVTTQVTRETFDEFNICMGLSFSMATWEKSVPRDLYACPGRLLVKQTFNSLIL